MGKARMASGLFTGCLLLWGAAPALAQPTVARMLSFKPRQQGLQISTPTPEEQAACKVELEQSKRPGASGWVLLDAQKRKLRRFFDSNGDKKIDVWSYYKDGAEVYREIDGKLGNRPNLRPEQSAIPDQYRWLNGGGMRWGLDPNEDGKIDSWKMVSAEEAAEEAYHAVATRDLARLRAVLITGPELSGLRLSAAHAERWQKRLAGVEAKFQETIKKPGTPNEKSHFVRVESAVPQCVPAEDGKAEQDLFKHSGRVVLFETADKKHEFLSTGPMVQVGQAWRLLDAPGPDTGGVTPPPQNEDPVVAELMKKLSDLDKSPPAPAPQPGHNPDLVRYYQQRVALLEQLRARAPEKDRESWTKQLADNLNTWAQSSEEKDKTALQKLGQLREQVVKTAGAGSNLAGYVTYRELWAKYGPLLIKVDDHYAKVQREWSEELSKFVQQYPKAEDTPDALIQLAMGSEVAGKEDEAKRWYQQIVTNFAGHALAPKARGSVRRLELTGKPLELSGPTLGGQPFDIAKLRGKVVVVYYWASYCRDIASEIATLRKLLSAQGSKGLELVTVNLDERAEDAQKCLQSNALTAPHLFQASENAAGMGSPLATQYGIMGLPTVFLVGKDGNVISRTLQVNSLEEAVKKAL
ncbi:MAG: redoxin domain-containing protein [Gemmataceae bacterium]|nr:redoxin domain-containing protein [Gemmataceae bacterium]